VWPYNEKKSSLFKGADPLGTQEKERANECRLSGRIGKKVRSRQAKEAQLGQSESNRRDFGARCVLPGEFLGLVEGARRKGN